MSRIAFVGLGIMGSPMAVHLARAGHEVVGYNRSPGKSGPLEAAGGRSAESVAEAVDGADVVATMVPDSPDVEEVLRGDGGVLEHAAPGALLIDFSTIPPDVAWSLAAEAESRGMAMLDAPVSGGERGAVGATLSIMVGGSDEAFERAGEILGAVGGTIVHVGGAGAGQTVKAANQLIVATNIAALAEAVVFLRAYDVDLGAALEVLGGGLAGSAVLDQKADSMRAGDFPPGFRIALHHKDLGIVTAAAREQGLVTPVAALVAQLIAAAVASGDGGLDHAGLLRTIERLNGGA